MALQGYLDLRNLALKGQRVFLRLDLNVPIEQGKILDETRIRAAVPTIKYLLEVGAKVIAASHLGRPETPEDWHQYSLEPVAAALNKYGIEVMLMDSPLSDAPLELTKNLKENQIIMLENLRFAEGETKNSGELAQRWGRLCDVYVNDAFGACHRAHASIDALAKIKPIRAMGFLIQKEIESLDIIKDAPPAPFVVVTGGSKIGDKIPLLNNFSEKAEAVVIGGAMAYTFLLAQGVAVGSSKVETDKLEMAKGFLARMETLGKKVHLPMDHVTVKDINAGDYQITEGKAIPAGAMAVDIGPRTRQQFASVIKNAGSVFWNGPMGVYEKPQFAAGSVAVAQAIAESDCFSVVGGGDSAAVAVDSGFAEQMSHVSTGGGASMEYIQGVLLPGLEVLKVRTLA